MEIFKRYETKNKLIVMSGGIDSNTILLDTVQDYLNGKFDGDIIILYINSDSIKSTKRDKEQETILNIIKKVKEEKGVDIKTIVANSTLTGLNDYILYLPMEGEYVGSLLLPQTSIWVGQILTILPQFRTSDVEILFGFNLNDNFHAESSKMIKKIIEDMANILHFGNSKIKVAFPLLVHNKWDIYDYFINNYPEYFELLWTCEMPDGDEECGYCDPCRVKANTLRRIIERDARKKTLKEELKNYKKAVVEISHLREEKKNTDNKISKILSDVTSTEVEVKNTTTDIVTITDN